MLVNKNKQPESLSMVVNEKQLSITRLWRTVGINFNRGMIIPRIQINYTREN